jgi:hypothetical protein
VGVHPFSLFPSNKCKFPLIRTFNNESLFFAVCSCCAEMDLFAVVKLEKPKQVTVGVRPLRENEQPLLEATAGHLTVLGPVGHEDSPPLQVTPVQSVAPTVETAHEEEAHTESSDSVEILKPEEVLKPGG